MVYSKLAYYYDTLMDDVNYQEYIDILVKYKKEGSILDIGCGSGVLGILLAMRGFDVTFSDIDEEMLSVVYDTLHKNDLAGDIIVYDILDHIGKRFDIIFSTLDVINHLTDLTEVEIAFNNVYHGLNNHGVFIFDFLTVNYIDLLVGYSEALVDGDNFDIDWIVNKGPFEHSVIHQFNIYGDDDFIKETFVERTYIEKDVLSLINGVGFKILEKVYSEERIIIVCEKNIIT